MATTWTDRSPQFLRDGEQATKLGLRAGAYVLRNAVMRELAGGFTSGLFVTGNLLNSVTLSDVYPIGTSAFGIRCGTNVLYALYWELGHYNIFLRAFVRVEKWRPALMDSREDIRKAYSRTWQANMKQWKSRRR
jgi:hypothetical protein